MNQGKLREATEKREEARTELEKQLTPAAEPVLEEHRDFSKPVKVAEGSFSRFTVEHYFGLYLARTREDVAGVADVRVPFVHPVGAIPVLGLNMYVVYLAQDSSG